MTNTNELNETTIAYGTLDGRSAYFLISEIKKGIKYSFFESLTKISSFTIRDWAGFLHLSERSVQRYKKENGVFGAVSSEKILEITMLYKYGLEVFGNKENFDTWLVTKNISFGGIQPKELLDTSFGIGLIKDELSRIEQGILA